MSCNTKNIKTYFLLPEWTGVCIWGMYVPSLGGTAKILGRMPARGTHFNGSTVPWKRLPWKQPAVSTSIVTRTDRDSNAPPQTDNSWNPATGQANQRRTGDKRNFSVRTPQGAQLDVGGAGAKTLVEQRGIGAASRRSRQTMQCTYLSGLCLRCDYEIADVRAHVGQP